MDPCHCYQPFFSRVCQLDTWFIKQKGNVKVTTVCSNPLITKERRNPDKGHSALKPKITGLDYWEHCVTKKPTGRNSPGACSRRGSRVTPPPWWWRIPPVDWIAWCRKFLNSSLSRGAIQRWRRESRRPSSAPSETFCAGVATTTRRNDWTQTSLDWGQKHPTPAARRYSSIKLYICK